MIQDQCAIKVCSITKSFNISAKSGKKRHLVLDNISFEINKGEIVGILGRNGSGKSTLLNIISRVMYPDSGSVLINGKVASILELSMGFQNDMTGRENIYLKAELYHFKKKEINNRINDVIKYADLGDYIDQPLRTYSSGMRGRLAFAIMVNVDADILLIDEVLSTGDASFNIKARQHFFNMAAKGKTIVVVSHNISTLEGLCSRSLWLEKGVIRKDDTTKKVSTAYLKEISESYDIISELAESGVPSSQYELSKMMLDEESVYFNYDVGLSWLKKSAENGYSKAELEYANILCESDSKEDVLQALVYYRSASDKGEKGARLQLAKHTGAMAEVLTVSLKDEYRQFMDWNNPYESYRYGIFLLKLSKNKNERKKGFEIIKKSADMGCLPAQYYVSLMYRDGIGVKKDINLFEKYAKMASQRGHLKSYLVLAEAYNTGLCLDTTEELCFNLFLKAAMCGDSDSQYRVACRFRDGRGTIKNEKAAGIWFNRYYISQYSKNVSWVLEQSKNNLDWEKESHYLHLITQTFNQNAIIDLAVLLKRKCPRSAFLLYKKMSTIGSTYLIHLANCYYMGIGCTVDYKLALKMYCELVNDGDSFAAYRLYLMYSRGLGTDVDTIKADYYLQLGAFRLNKQCVALLKKLRKK